eukprot:s148_g10.t1
MPSSSFEHRGFQSPEAASVLGAERWVRRTHLGKKKAHWKPIRTSGLCLRAGSIALGYVCPVAAPAQPTVRLVFQQSSHMGRDAELIVPAERHYRCEGVKTTCINCNRHYNQSIEMEEEQEEELPYDDPGQQVATAGPGFVSALADVLTHLSALRPPTTGQRESINNCECNYRRLVDADALGNTPSDGVKPLEVPPPRFNPGSNGELVHCSEVVVKGDYEWRIEGISWLINALEQNEANFAESCTFIDFSLVYHPEAGEVGYLGQSQRGSLCIVHHNGDGITFRYKALVKNAEGQWVQWGQEGNECHTGSDTSGRAFGPDVYFADSAESPPHSMGIFGMSHEDPSLPT